jgi:hypothetical protein
MLKKPPRTLEQVNPPAKVVYEAELRSTWDMQVLYLSENEAAQYNADPDAYVAREVGLTKDEYREWIHLGGQAMCGHRLKTGKLCGNGASGLQLDAETLKRRHPVARCHCHAEEDS